MAVLPSEARSPGEARSTDAHGRAHRSDVVFSTYGGFRSECHTVNHPDPAGVILLLGGAFQRKESWGRLASLLGKTFTLITADLPGWGTADLLPDSYSIDFLADSLHALMTAAGHRRFHVFGGSYSSAIAYRYAQKHPETVGSLALTGTTRRMTDQMRRTLEHCLAVLADKQPDQFAEFIVNILLNGLPVGKRGRQAAVRRILTDLFRTAPQDQIQKFEHNTRRLLARPLYYPAPPMTVPALVMTGQYDSFTPPELGQELAMTCCNSAFLVLRDAGHAVHLEVPNELADLLTRFFTGQPIDDLP